MCEVGAVVSEDADAAWRPDWSVPGCIPMSAKTLTVACCASGFAGSPVGLPMRFHDHCTEPVESTRAPFAVLYMVTWCVWVPEPVVWPKSLMTDGSVSVVVEFDTRPGGREPLSTSDSHS